MAASSFELMQQLERTDGFPNLSSPHDPDDRQALRVREGHIGGHRRYLSPDDVAYVQQACRTGSTPATTALLARVDLSV